MPAGRPPIFETPDELQSAIEQYFDEKKEFVTVTGLAYRLGFESRQSIYDYKERPEFSYIIKRATLWIESMYEAKLSGNNVAGSVFALKNMGWRDKVETGITNNAGDDVEQVVIFKIPDNGRDNTATAGLPDKGTD